MKVLIINSESDMIKRITFCLQMRYSDLDVIATRSADNGLHLIESESPDLVFLSCASPATDCVGLIGEIREFSNVGLILVGEDETGDMERAEYLETGADECIAMSLSPMEILGRVKALMRRIDGIGFQQDRVFMLGEDLVINFGSHEVFVCGKRVKLTPTEYRLLCELVRNAGRVMPHKMLLEKVWSPEYSDDLTLIKKYVYRLRHKIEANPNEPQLVLSERGVGYRFARQA
jgi:two-component system KDP operon response regulator KdpE